MLILTNILLFLMVTTNGLKIILAGIQTRKCMPRMASFPVELTTSMLSTSTSLNHLFARLFLTWLATTRWVACISTTLHPVGSPAICWWEGPCSIVTLPAINANRLPVQSIAFPWLCSNLANIFAIGQLDCKVCVHIAARSVLKWVCWPSKHKLQYLIALITASNSFGSTIGNHTSMAFLLSIGLRPGLHH